MFFHNFLKISAMKTYTLYFVVQKQNLISHEKLSKIRFYLPFHSQDYIGTDISTFGSRTHTEVTAWH